ncbi:hypothetical protein IAG44_17615 [Streptomyces roseirectus]|uniref:Uncharacterized protein n=1 Tax=Streptomyces roseirectus TaxID=2768066 RepID=A0A7H0IE58_9ACTN|nr:hypothetical protein [Streptomyces roseirectus]QNP71074.1 hypothetical protein IAG44_17615 [Streptomyces roseirectus]
MTGARTEAPEARTDASDARTEAPRTPTAPLPDVTLDMLYRLLGVAEHESRRELIRRGRRVSPRLPQLLISAAAREGVALGSGASDELRRARARAGRYADLFDAVRAAVPGVRIAKGPSVARWYPPDLLRPVGDLDLSFATEDELWRAALTVTGRAPVEDIVLALTRHEGRTSVTLGLRWPAEDELLDRPYNVELSMVAFPGDPGSAVPPRRTLPADQTLADLLALAEERFQRPFHAKDAVDVLMILTHCPPPPATLAEAAAAHHLAPELLELLTYTQDGTQAPLDAFRTPLHEPAAAELARREAAERPADPPTTVDARLDAGFPVAGLRLNRRDTQTTDAASPDTPATLHSVSPDTLAAPRAVNPDTSPTPRAASPDTPATLHSVSPDTLAAPRAVNPDTSPTPRAVSPDTPATLHSVSPDAPVAPRAVHPGTSAAPAVHPGPPATRSVRHDTNGITLLRTPLADFLLVCGEVVSWADYETALAALDRLEAVR